MKNIIILGSMVFGVGCESESFVERARLEKQEERKLSIAALEEADCLEDFWEVQKNNWKLGPESLDVNYISGKRRQWYVNNQTDLSPKITETNLAVASLALSPHSKPTRLKGQYERRSYKQSNIVRC